MKHKIVLASNNAGKLKEFSTLLSPLGFEVHNQGEFNVPFCPEPHPTFIENALAKARHATLLTGLPALADDSGICVNALGGAPGVHSARYAGGRALDHLNNAKLVADMAKHTDKTAYYYTVLVFLRHANDPQPVIAEGRWIGAISAEPRGANGFGYDPHFYLPDLQRMAAELSLTEKNKYSHRGQALRQLVAKLR